MEGRGITGQSSVSKGSMLGPGDGGQEVEARRLEMASGGMAEKKVVRKEGAGEKAI